MKKELLLGFILFLMFSVPLAFCLEAQDLIQIGQIVKDKNSEMESRIIQKIQEKQEVNTGFKEVVAQALREERIKNIIGNATAFFLALILYSLIKFKLKIKDENQDKNNKKIAELKKIIEVLNQKKKAEKKQEDKK